MQTFSDILISGLIQFLPVLIWMVTEIFHLDRFVLNSIDKSVDTEKVIVRYGLYTMLISFFTSFSVTAISQRNINMGVLWDILVIMSGPIFLKIVTADDGSKDEKFIKKLQKFLIDYKYFISIIIFGLIILTELFHSG